MDEFVVFARFADSLNQCLIDAICDMNGGLRRLPFLPPAAALLLSVLARSS